MWGPDLRLAGVLARAKIGLILSGGRSVSHKTLADGVQANVSSVYFKVTKYSKT